MTIRHRLRVACERGELDEVKRLVNEGTDVVSTDGRGWTPLVFATINGHVDVLRFLIDRGADINKKTHQNYTALHRAAYNGHYAAARLLIERGANLHMKSNHGLTPLDWAKQNYKSSTAAIIEAAMKSIKVIYTSSQDLQKDTVTFKDFSNNIILITDNDIPDGFEFERHPTFTLQHIQQLINRLLAIDDDDNLFAQHHPAIYQRMKYWGMNLLHLMVYFPQHSNNDHASLNLGNDEKQILSSLLDLYSPQAIASVDIHRMTPLHHAVINSTRQRRMSQECYELLLTKSPSIVVHRAIQAGMDWNQLCPIIMGKLNALTVEDEETGLMPFMIAAEKYHKDEESGNANDMLLRSLDVSYELLCLQPDVMKEYDVSINMAKRSYKDMSGF